MTKTQTPNEKKRKAAFKSKIIYQEESYYIGPCVSKNKNKK